MSANNALVALATTLTLFSGAAVMADRSHDDDFGMHGKAPFSFALIGDVPYGVAPGADYPPVDALIADINHDRKLRWVMHAGDIKSGSSECSDAMFADRLARFAAFDKPVIYTPGDNEWTDCHRAKAGGYAPLERLAALRRVFFSHPGETIGGDPMEVDSQASRPGYQEFPENVRWQREGVVFATLHVVGSQNGLAPFAGRSAADDAEVARRIDADIAWLDETFAQARENDSPGVFLMIQADPGLDAEVTDHAGFEAILTELEAQVRAYGKPVVLAHGDSHYFRVDKPGLLSGQFLANFTRAETFGSSRVHWVKVTVDPRSDEVFSFQQQIVAANR